MQSDFAPARNPHLIEKIENLASSFEGLVVNLQYDGSGHSTVNLPEGASTIYKREVDGGDEIYAFATGARLVRRDVLFKVVGVNSFACVLDTARTLGWRLREKHGITKTVVIDLNYCGDETSYCSIIPPEEPNKVPSLESDKWRS